jgi:hypothetical protein
MELKFTGTAVLPDLTYGKETVTFRWNPDAVFYQELCPPGTGLCDPIAIAFSPLVSVQYEGLVNGGPFPSAFFSQMNRLGETSSQFSGTRTFAMFQPKLFAEPLVFCATLGSGPCLPLAGTFLNDGNLALVSGGEDGFEWYSVFQTFELFRLLTPLQRDEAEAFSFVFRAVAVSEPATLALLIASFAVFATRRRPPRFIMQSVKTKRTCSG